MSFFYRYTNIQRFFESFHVLFSMDQYTLVRYKIYKYDPFVFDEPWIQTYILPMYKQYSMLLDNLFLLKNEKDESISFRRSCREGICGSCAMNINGENTLACTYVMKDNLSSFKPEVKVFPLPHMPVVKDLIVSMKHFYSQYKSISPFLKKLYIADIFYFTKYSLLNVFVFNVNIYAFRPTKEQIQFDRFLLNGLYECILCACCSTSCPSYWWNQDRYLGPAVLLQAYRWIIDSRDDFFFDRLEQLNDFYKIGRCHSILNCVSACPKGLNPAEAINNTKAILHMKEE